MSVVLIRISKYGIPWARLNHHRHHHHHRHHRHHPITMQSSLTFSPCDIDRYITLINVINLQIGFCIMEVVVSPLKGRPGRIKEKDQTV